MIRGGHKVLPMATDYAVLLPNQELRQELDHEFNGNETNKQERETIENEVHREESEVKLRMQRRGKILSKINRRQRTCVRLEAKETGADGVSGYT